MFLRKFLVAYVAIVISASANSNYKLAKQALKTIKSDSQAIANVLATTPITYEFTSKFDNKSSVKYYGETFRQVLMNDIKSAMGGQLRETTKYSKQDLLDMLNSYYKYNENNPLALNLDIVIDGFIDFKTKAKDLNDNPIDIAEGFVYSDIQSPGKNLYGKMAGIDNPLRRRKLYGTSTAATPDEYVNSLFNEFAENAVNGKNFTVPNGSLAPQTITTASLTKDGRDLSQLVQKFMIGAISYSQAANDYLSTELGATKGLNADNTKVQKSGVNYTAKEHFFDEAFGYFGGHRYFNQMADEDIMKSRSTDYDSDNMVSLFSEVNMGIAKNFGRLDFLAADKDMDLSAEVMNAFLQGRHLITEAPQGYQKYVEALSLIALGAWEKTIGGTTIVYINLTLKEIEQYGTIEYKFDQFAKYWSEMKGFAFGFQFNPKGIMTDAEFDQLHALMGEAPILPHAAKADVDAYKQKLIDARNLIGKIYGFSANNVANW